MKNKQEKNHVALLSCPIINPMMSHACQCQCYVTLTPLPLIIVESPSYSSHWIKLHLQPPSLSCWAGSHSSWSTVHPHPPSPLPPHPLEFCIPTPHLMHSWDSWAQASITCAQAIWVVSRCSHRCIFTMVIFVLALIYLASMFVAISCHVERHSWGHMPCRWAICVFVVLYLPLMGCMCHQWAMCIRGGGLVLLGTICCQWSAYPLGTRTRWLSLGHNVIIVVIKWYHCQAQFPTVMVLSAVHHQHWWYQWVLEEKNGETSHSMVHFVTHL